MAFQFTLKIEEIYYFKPDKWKDALLGWRTNQKDKITHK